MEDRKPDTPPPGFTFVYGSIVEDGRVDLVRPIPRPAERETPAADVE